MTIETPIEMLHLPEQLRNMFTGKLPEAASGTPLERERNFLSRSLAAYAIHKLGGAELDDAAAAVVDGGGDGGIDAIFHSATANILWIAQAKFISTGRGEPELGDVTKFKTGLENLMQGNFDAFRSNTLWNRILPQIQAVFERGGLQVRAILYHYKTDVERPAPDETNFSLEEATTACACLDQQNDCDLCTRVMANRQSLWSMDEIYPPDELMRSRYSRVFRPDRSARTVWRAVQTQRLVITIIQDSARAESGIRKTFFENARWLALNLVFLKLRCENGAELTLSQEEKDQITRETIEVAETLWRACEALGFVTRRTDIQSGYDIYEQPRHFRSIFSTAADCRQLRGKTLSMMA